MARTLSDEDVEAVASRVVEMIATRLSKPPTVQQTPTPVTESKPAPLPDKLAYPLKELAKLLGVSPVTIYRLEARGLIRSIQYLRTKVYTKREVMRFLDQGTLDTIARGDKPVRSTRDKSLTMGRHVSRLPHLFTFRELSFLHGQSPKRRARHILQIRSKVERGGPGNRRIHFVNVRPKPNRAHPNLVSAPAEPIALAHRHPASEMGDYSLRVVLPWRDGADLVCETSSFVGLPRYVFLGF